MREIKPLTLREAVGRALLYGFMFGVFLGALEPYLVLYLSFIQAHLTTRMSALHLITVSLILNIAVSAFVAVVAAFFYHFWSLWRNRVPTGTGTFSACWAAFAVFLLVVLFSGYLNPRFEIAPQGTWANWVLKGVYPLVAVALAMTLQTWIVRRGMRIFRWCSGLAAGGLALSLGLVLLLFGVVEEPFRGQAWRKVDPSLARAPNIILILLDTLRADHLSVYGYKRRTSPQLERLAKEGVLFENAFSHSNWTPPSTTTLLTSLYESVHGVNRVNSYLPDGVTTLAEVLRGAGYTSAFWSANGLVSIRANYTQGFDYASQVSDAYQAIRGRNRLPVYQLYAWRSVDHLSQWFYPNWENNPQGSAPFPPPMAALEALNVSLEHLFNEVSVDKTDMAGVEKGAWVRAIKPFPENVRAAKADWMYEHVRAYLSYMTSQLGYDPRRNKFFLYLHYMDPHAPYRATGAYRRIFDPDFRGRSMEGRKDGATKVCRDVEGAVATGECYVDNYWLTRTEGPLSERELHNMVAQYDGEILFLDRFLAELIRFLKKKGFFENTLLVITSDHGEGFYEHKKYGHGKTLYQEEVHIPLLVTWPRALPRGVRLPDPVGLVDIMPTLLEAVGVPPVPCMQGRSLLGVMRGTEHRRELYGETAFYRRGIIFFVRDQMKLIYAGLPDLRSAPRPQPRSKYLFNLKDDPGEKKNLLGSKGARKLPPQLVKSLQGSMDRWYKTVREACRFYKPREADIPKDIEERLKALGYRD